jgi:quercetin dioxygenase-like cupin family protein
VDRAGAIRVLEDEGWSVTEWTDEPGVAYPAHAHPSREVRLVVDGSMTITADGVAHKLASGDRFDIDPDVEHSSVVGPDGVRYLAGRKG